MTEAVTIVLAALTGLTIFAYNDWKSFARLSQAIGWLLILIGIATFVFFRTTSIVADYVATMPKLNPVVAAKISVNILNHYQLSPAYMWLWLGSLFYYAFLNSFPFWVEKVKSQL